MSLPRFQALLDLAGRTAFTDPDLIPCAVFSVPSRNTALLDESRKRLGVVTSDYNLRKVYACLQLVHPCLERVKLEVPPLPANFRTPPAVEITGAELVQTSGIPMLSGRLPSYTLEYLTPTEGLLTGDGLRTVVSVRVSNGFVTVGWGTEISIRGVLRLVSQAWAPGAMVTVRFPQKAGSLRDTSGRLAEWSRAHELLRETDLSDLFFGAAYAPHAVGYFAAAVVIASRQ